MPATKQLLEAISAGRYDERFAGLYGPEPEMLQMQRQRYMDAIKAFVELYGEQESVRLYSTPGRTEIGGNHTDHNHGIVMAAAVNLDVIAVVAKTNDNIAAVKSKGFEKTDSVDMSYLQPGTQEFGTSAALIRGVGAAIAERGGTVGGFCAYTTSDVLRGSGLSSSAAFEVLMGCILNHEYNEGRFSAVELGMIGQFAENKFFGKPSGLMDQTACAVGSAITIDFKDPSSPIVDKVAFDLAAQGYKLVITDTKGSHANLTDEYAGIRAEMEQVAQFFGKSVLREVEEAQLYNKIAEVRAAVNDRAVLRAMHFFAECRRAPQLAKAAAAGNMVEFLRLIRLGGHSSFEYNQNAYSVKDPGHQGVALGLALSQHVLEGRGAWRLQGGGFAGTIQAFVPDDLLEEYRATLTKVFGADACYVLNVRGTGCTMVTEG